MALTQEQWYAKIVKFVPSWWFEKYVFAPAIFQGIAAVFAQIQQDIDDAQSATFILQSPAPIVDLLGYERSVSRLPGESTPVYAPRIQNMFNQVNPVALLKLINDVLIQGTATIREHGNGDGLFIGQSYINRAEVFTYIYYNTFSVIIDKQVPNPNSFISRSYFLNEASYLGTNESSAVVLSLLNLILNDNQAGGTLYRLFERSS
jgi:hypothetical protein